MVMDILIGGKYNMIYTNPIKISLADHSFAVFLVAKKLFEKLNLPSDDDFFNNLENALEVATIFHDIGKCDPKFQGKISKLKLTDLQLSTYEYYIRDFLKSKALRKRAKHNEISWAILNNSFLNYKNNPIISDANKCLRTLSSHAVFWSHSPIEECFHYRDDISILQSLSPEDLDTLILNIEEFIEEIESWYAYYHIPFNFSYSKLSTKNPRNNVILVLDIRRNDIRLIDNCKLFLIRAILKKANFLVNNLDKNELDTLLKNKNIESIVDQDIIPQDNILLKNKISQYLDSFGKTTKTLLQIKAIKDIEKNNNFGIIGGPEGIGKTALSLRYYFNNNALKSKILYICPTISICESVSDYLNKNLNEVNIKIYNSETITDMDYNFDADINITTIDQFAKCFKDQKKSHLFLDYFWKYSLIFDEWHEISNILGYSVLFELLITLYKKLQNPNLLLMSGTPAMARLAELEINKKVIKMKHYHSKPIQLEFVEYYHDLDKRYLPLQPCPKGTYIITNSYKMVYMGALNNLKKEDVFLAHSYFAPNEKNNLISRLIQTFSNPTDKILRGSYVAQCSLNVSFGNTLITDICPPEDFKQRAGRCNRFGEYDTAKIIICVPKIPEEKENEVVFYGKIGDDNIPISANKVNHNIRFSYFKSYAWIKFLKERIGDNYTTKEELDSLYYDFYNSKEKYIQQAILRDEKHRTEILIKQIQLRSYEPTNLNFLGKEFFLNKTLRGESRYINTGIYNLINNKFEFSGEHLYIPSKKETWENAMTLNKTFLSGILKDDKILSESRHINAPAYLIKSKNEQLENNDFIYSPKFGLLKVKNIQHYF